MFSTHVVVANQVEQIAELLDDGPIGGRSLVEWLEDVNESSSD